MLPFINAVYKKKEDRVAAMKRHMSYFNITPAIVTFPLGIAGSMEEENASKPDFDISSIKASNLSIFCRLLICVKHSLSWNIYIV